jgi:hypothetical protein
MRQTNEAANNIGRLDLPKAAIKRASEALSGWHSQAEDHFLALMGNMLC